MAFPLVIVMFPIRYPIFASVVANYGLPNIRGCPSSLFLGLITKTSTGYSQESTWTIMSSRVPSSLTTNLSANSNNVEVGFKAVILKILQVS